MMLHVVYFIVRMWLGLLIPFPCALWLVWCVFILFFEHISYGDSLARFVIFGGILSCLFLCAMCSPVQHLDHVLVTFSTTMVGQKRPQQAA